MNNHHPPYYPKVVLKGIIRELIDVLRLIRSDIVDEAPAVITVRQIDEVIKKYEHIK
jgi:hypothetical protein